jgi:hypothetical protein
MTKNLGSQTAVILEAGGHISDIVFGFDDWLSGVTAFHVRQTSRVLSNLLRQLEENAATILCGGLRPRAGIKGSTRGFHGGIDISGVCRGHTSDNLFGGRVVNRERLAGRASEPVAIYIVLIRSDVHVDATGHDIPPNFVAARAHSQRRAKNLNLPALQLPVYERLSAGCKQKRRMPLVQ